MSKIETIQNKIIALEPLLHVVAGWRLKGQKLTFTNGCFDVLHRGHISLIMQAAEAGQRLVIGLNSDASVRKLKGDNRPIHQEADRALLLAAMTYVDAVVIFEEDTPLNLITQLQPDILVKGGDYTKETIVGADFIIKNGGQVLIVPTEKGYSSTDSINRI